MLKVWFKYVLKITTNDGGFKFFVWDMGGENSPPDLGFNSHEGPFD